MNKQSSLGNAHYDVSSNTIYFATSESMTFESIVFHEFFHAYQATIHPSMGQYGKGKPEYVQIEFEQAVFADLKQGGASRTTSNYFPQDDQDKYSDWIEEVSKSLKVDPDYLLTKEFETEYNSYLNKFNTITNPYHSDLDLNLGFPALKSLSRTFNGK